MGIVCHTFVLGIFPPDPILITPSIPPSFHRLLLHSPPHRLPLVFLYTAFQRSWFLWKGIPIFLFWILEFFVLPIKVGSHPIPGWMKIPWSWISFCNFCKEIDGWLLLKPNCFLWMGSDELRIVADMWQITGTRITIGRRINEAERGGGFIEEEE